MSQSDGDFFRFCVSLLSLRVLNQFDWKQDYWHKVKPKGWKTFASGKAIHRGEPVCRAEDTPTKSEPIPQKKGFKLS